MQVYLGDYVYVSRDELKGTNIDVKHSLAQVQRLYQTTEVGVSEVFMTTITRDAAIVAIIRRIN